MTSTIESIEKKYKDCEFEPICMKIGFNQHLGECWNDSIQMFFVSQDEIKDVVQRKLYFLEVDEIINLAILRGRKKYLPKMYSDETGKSKYDKMIDDISVYLCYFKKRFLHYIDTYHPDYFHPKKMV
jgi:hypothetical protein